jgi:hypothetical protein
MDTISLSIAQHAATLHISQSITVMLLQQTTQQQWLPEQLQYVTKHAKKLISGATYDISNGSSADKLIHYLKKQNDVIYIILTDKQVLNLCLSVAGRPHHANLTITTKSGVLALQDEIQHEAHDDALHL